MTTIGFLGEPERFTILKKFFLRPGSMMIVSPGLIVSPLGLRLKVVSLLTGICLNSTLFSDNAMVNFFFFD